MEKALETRLGSPSSLPLPPETRPENISTHEVPTFREIANIVPLFAKHRAKLLRKMFQQTQHTKFTV